MKILKRLCVKPMKFGQNYIEKKIYSLNIFTIHPK